MVHTSYFLPENLTYVGPSVDDPDLLKRMPPGLGSLLDSVNGFVAFRGGLHVRGVCETPEWHSLQKAWTGSHALSRLYPLRMKGDDIPFGQDCFGDQFVLREGNVWKLWAETGEVEPLDTSVPGFLGAAIEDPIGYLQLQPLERFLEQGGNLPPGSLLHAFPPFSSKEARLGVTMSPVPALEAISYLAALAAKLGRLGEGDALKVEPIEPPGQ